MQRFENVSIDSRNISAKDLFVAIAGDVHDGHAFISDVVEQGARGLIVNSEKARDLPMAAWQTRNICLRGCSRYDPGPGRSGRFSPLTNRCCGNCDYGLKRQNHHPPDDR